jgi:hypothetical protein
MSLVDDVFSSVPGQLVKDWGTVLTYVKTTTPRTYDPTTGDVTGSDSTVKLRGIISRISSREAEGLYQSTDISILIGNKELGNYFPTQADRVRYKQGGVEREAKIIEVRSYRGDKPLYHQLIARPQ